MSGRRWLLAVVVAGLLGACSNGDGGSDASADRAETTEPGQAGTGGAGAGGGAGDPVVPTGLFLVESSEPGTSIGSKTVGLAASPSGPVADLEVTIGGIKPIASMPSAGDDLVGRARLPIRGTDVVMPIGDDEALVVRSAGGPTGHDEVVRVDLASGTTEVVFATEDEAHGDWFSHPEHPDVLFVSYGQADQRASEYWFERRDCLRVEADGTSTVLQDGIGCRFQPSGHVVGMDEADEVGLVTSLDGDTIEVDGEVSGSAERTLGTDRIGELIWVLVSDGFGSNDLVVLDAGGDELFRLSSLPWADRTESIHLLDSPAEGGLLIEVLLGEGGIIDDSSKVVFIPPSGEAVVFDDLPSSDPDADVLVDEAVVAPDGTTVVASSATAGSVAIGSDSRESYRRVDRFDEDGALLDELLEVPARVATVGSPDIDLAVVGDPEDPTVVYQQILADERVFQTFLGRLGDGEIEAFGAPLFESASHVYADPTTGDVFIVGQQLGREGHVTILPGGDPDRAAGEAIGLRDRWPVLDLGGGSIVLAGAPTDEFGTVIIGADGVETAPRPDGLSGALFVDAEANLIGSTSDATVVCAGTDCTNVHQVEGDRMLFWSSGPPRDAYLLQPRDASAREPGYQQP